MCNIPLDTLWTPVRWSLKPRNVNGVRSEFMVRRAGGWGELSWRSGWPRQITQADPGHRGPLSPPLNPFHGSSAPSLALWSNCDLRLWEDSSGKSSLISGRIDGRDSAALVLWGDWPYFHLSVNVWWPDGGSCFCHLASLKWCYRMKYWVSGINMCFYARGAGIRQAGLGHRGKHVRWDDYVFMRWMRTLPQSLSDRLPHGGGLG